MIFEVEIEFFPGDSCIMTKILLSRFEPLILDHMSPFGEAYSFERWTFI